MTNEEKAWDQERQPAGEPAGEDESIPGLPFDPTSTGMGPWEAEISDEEWIEAACNAINDIGARAYLRRMLAELRELLNDDEVLESRDWLDVLAGHLVGKRVLSASALPGLPGVMLTFDDGHTVPIMRPPWLRGAPPDYAACANHYLVAVAVRDDGAHPAWFELVFDPDAAHIDQWHEGRGLRFNTLERSAQAVYCPYDHDGPPTDADLDSVLGRLHAHVVGKRVADHVRLPGDVTALVFDDWHVLPLAQVSAGPAGLEGVVGLFCLWAGPAGEPERVRLLFGDDLELTPRLRAGKLTPEAAVEAGTTAVDSTLDSVAALFWANEADQEDWGGPDDADE
jgi:hypothetical protein